MTAGELAMAHHPTFEYTTLEVPEGRVAKTIADMSQQGWEPHLICPGAPITHPDGATIHYYWLILRRFMPTTAPARESCPSPPPR